MTLIRGNLFHITNSDFQRPVPDTEVSDRVSRQVGDAGSVFIVPCSVLVFYCIQLTIDGLDRKTG